MPDRRRNWVQKYLSEQQTMALCEDYRRQTVKKPPDWMIFWYDSSYDAS